MSLLETKILRKVKLGDCQMNVEAILFQVAVPCRMISTYVTSSCAVCKGVSSLTCVLKPLV